METLQRWITQAACNTSWALKAAKKEFAVKLLFGFFVVLLCLGVCFFNKQHYAATLVGFLSRFFFFFFLLSLTSFCNPNYKTPVLCWRWRSC